MLKIFDAEKGANLEAVKRLFKEYPNSLHFDLSFQNFDEESDKLPGEYVPPKGCLLLAKHLRQEAGCVALKGLSKDVCEMKRLYVRPQFRRRGIGRTLAEAVIERAKQAGYTSIRLDTAMEPAKKMYASMGFKQISPYEYNPVESAVFMELTLV